MDSTIKTFLDKNSNEMISSHLRHCGMLRMITDNKLSDVMKYVKYIIIILMWELNSSYISTYHTTYWYRNTQTNCAALCYHSDALVYADDENIKF